MSAGKSFWWVTVATAVAVLTTLSLGQWQLNRGAEKRNLQDRIDRQAQRDVLDARALLATNTLTELVHRPARLRGRWLAEHTVFLENRQMAGRPGFFVLTPLQLNGSQQALMVQRGWVPRDFTDRSKLPVVPTTGGEVEVTVRIVLPPSRLFDFNGPDTGRVRQNLDLEAFAAEKSLNLLTTISALETGAASEGLLRAWPVVNAGVDKHDGYAFQWFGLAGLFTILYAWFQIIQPRRRRGTTR